MSYIENGYEYHDGFFVNEKEISIFEGKLLTYIELLGLSEKQEEAMKSEVRNLIWGRFFMSRATTVSAKEIAELRKQQSGFKPAETLK